MVVRPLRRAPKRLSLPHKTRELVGPFNVQYALPGQVGLEVLDHKHFYLFSQRQTAKSQLRTRVLSALGWRMVTYQHQGWRAKIGKLWSWQFAGFREIAPKPLGEGAKGLWVQLRQIPFAPVKCWVAPVQNKVLVVQEPFLRLLLPCPKRPFAPSPDHFRRFAYHSIPRRNGLQPPAAGFGKRRVASVRFGHRLCEEQSEQFWFEARMVPL